MLSQILTTKETYLKINNVFPRTIINIKILIIIQIFLHDMPNI